MFQYISLLWREWVFRWCLNDTIYGNINLLIGIHSMSWFVTVHICWRMQHKWIYLTFQLNKPISEIVVKFCLCFLHGHALSSSIYVGLLSLIAINDRTLWWSGCSVDSDLIKTIWGWWQECNLTYFFVMQFHRCWKWSGFRRCWHTSQNWVRIVSYITKQPSCPGNTLD